MQLMVRVRTLSRRWSREPLVHFAVLAVAVLALHRWVAAPPAKRIDVSPDLIAGLRQDYARRIGAPPSAEDEAALLQRFIDSEIMYREAVALGLDRGDVIVRRRLVQKMEFLLEGAAAAIEPTDGELEAYRAAHRERYTVPGRVSLVHVFVSRDRHGDETEPHAAALHDLLRGGADPATLGDPFIKGGSFVLQAEAELAAVFGAEAAAPILALPVGAWSDPLPSSYGLHLVRVSEHQPGRDLALAEAREAVRGDWESDRRGSATRDGIERLRQEYEIVVVPAAAPASKVAQAR